MSSNSASPRKPKGDPANPGTRAQTAHNHHQHKIGWNSEIADKFTLFPGTIHAFIERFLQTPNAGDPPNRDVSQAFQGLVETRQEEKIVEFLVPGLHELTRDLPEDKRLKFKDTRSTMIQFPYASYNKDVRGTKPDVSTTQPGEVFEDGMKLRWDGISLVFEIKPRWDQDPLLPTRQLREDDKDTLRQLAIDARNLMAAHLSLFTFVVGIYGPTTRIYRFDRAGCIASPLFNYRDEPEIFRAFFWRFVHPPHGVRFFGLDPTVKPATAEDLEWAEENLQKNGKVLSPEGRATSRWLEVHCPEDGTYKRYLTVGLLFLNSHLFSRSTMVWIALEEESADMYALKDAWRQFIRTPETVYLKHLKEKYPGPGELDGLPELIIGGDLSKWEASQDVYATSPFTYHRTMWAEISGADKAYERCHMRLVVSPVGRPIFEFRSTKEMVTTIRNAVAGHRKARRVGLLHRDVSSGNVLIVDEEQKKGPGLLCDFDYSSFQEPDTDGVAEVVTQPDGDGDEATELKERTGTLYFMAIEILEQPSGVLHTMAHDLESFYWLLVWITLRHTNHGQGPLIYSEIFPNSTDWWSHSAKSSWIRFRFRNVNIHGNNPLTWLIREWNALCAKQHSLRSEAPIPMTHDNVLQLLDEALAKDGWPEDDEAIEFQIPEDEQATTSHVTTTTTSQRKRSAAQRQEPRQSSSKRARTSKSGGDS
ncbi:hypothetical protein CERSUDRAFT_114935 [Gelatoporia subvermispora B]|uniref:Fungal-type protein kinase domain-containing protein n=1 Tax=Ceriporiopsis subvermispora (strain B) TaxID=914234 RepID=M2RF13_CERS8|nr:hypothetical protein CERSUDRAFT_114935 [Gelatoporia subvermispora B]